MQVKAVLRPPICRHPRTRSRDPGIHGRGSRRDGGVDGSRAPTAKAARDRVLVIEPVIKEMKFVSGGKRFFAGALAGAHDGEVHGRQNR